MRFELTRPFGPPVFKTGAINRSATPPALREYFVIAQAMSKVDRAVSCLPIGRTRPVASSIINQAAEPQLFSIARRSGRSTGITGQRDMFM